MAKARYTTDPKGHYGLGFDHYSHFTSPIRRYPDMMVHRLLARYLKSNDPADQEAYEAQCKHSSAMEKRASDAERASIKYKQAEYMKNFLDQELKGVVTGLTEWGLYVEAVETRCEGMVRLQSIPDDHYVYDPEKMKIVGRNTGRTFEFGDMVTVEVDQIDMEKRTIDLLLVD
jgi:ribonuclease R